MRRYSSFFLGMIKVLLLITGITISFCIDSAILKQASAEEVFVKYRGYVDLSPFNCDWVTRSSFINRLCYDKKEQYVIVLLRNTYYHYCEVPPSTVKEWKQADSMGRFYNAYIKGRFDCRIFKVPFYK